MAKGIEIYYETPFSFKVSRETHDSIQSFLQDITKERNYNILKSLTTSTSQLPVEIALSTRSCVIM